MYYTIILLIVILYRNIIYTYMCIGYANYLDPIIQKILYNKEPENAFKSNLVKVIDIKIYIKHPSATIIDHHDNHGCKIHFENWLNYIFYLSDIKPNTHSKINWEEADLVIITYNYNNNIYKIPLSKDFNNNTIRCNLKDRNFKSKIISAHIIKLEPYITKDITYELKKFMGPNYDFYEFNNNDSNLTTNINCILQDENLNNWDEITITNSFGEIQIINLKVNKYIKIANYSLF